MCACCCCNLSRSWPGAVARKNEVGLGGQQCGWDSNDPQMVVVDDIWWIPHKRFTTSGWTWASSSELRREVYWQRTSRTSQKPSCQIETNPTVRCLDSSPKSPPRIFPRMVPVIIECGDIYEAFALWSVLKLFVQVSCGTKTWHPELPSGSRITHQFELYCYTQLGPSWFVWVCEELDSMPDRLAQVVQAEMASDPSSVRLEGSVCESAPPHCGTCTEVFQSFQSHQFARCAGHRWLSVEYSEEKNCGRMVSYWKPDRRECKLMSDWDLLTFLVRDVSIKQIRQERLWGPCSLLPSKMSTIKCIALLPSARCESLGLDPNRCSGIDTELQYANLCSSQVLWDALSQLHWCLETVRRGPVSLAWWAITMVMRLDSWLVWELCIIGQHDDFPATYYIDRQRESGTDNPWCNRVRQGNWRFVASWQCTSLPSAIGPQKAARAVRPGTRCQQFKISKKIPEIPRDIQEISSEKLYQNPNICRTGAKQQWIAVAWWFAVFQRISTVPGECGHGADSCDILAVFLCHHVRFLLWVRLPTSVGEDRTIDTGLQIQMYVRSLCFFQEAGHCAGRSFWLCRRFRVC